MIFDCNAWVGNWPFRSLKKNTPVDLLEVMDLYGMGWAAVSSLDAVFHRNAQPANELLAQSVAPYSDRLFPLGAINPTYVKWEDDLTACKERLGMKGVRIYPQYHDYELAGPLGRRVAAACKERDLALFIAHRIEDPRQRISLDPGKIVTFDDLARLIAAVPGVKIVFTNARGNLTHHRLLQNELVHQKWYMDLSLVEGAKDLAGMVINPAWNHLVFGTHMPLTYPGCALVKLSLLDIDAKQQAAVEYGNAAEILGLQLA